MSGTGEGNAQGEKPPTFWYDDGSGVMRRVPDPPRVGDTGFVDRRAGIAEPVPPNPHVEKLLMRSD